MTITTYSELLAAVGEELNRADLDSRIPTFVSLAEADMLRRLRHWRMEARHAITLDARFVPLPDDWLETIRLEIPGEAVLDLTSVARMAEDRRRAADSSGRPCRYAHVAGELELFPSPDGAYQGELIYRQRVPALGPGQETNWVLDVAPDAYFYGTLLHTAPYLREDERVQVWGTIYSDVIAALVTEGERAQWSGTGLSQRVRAI